jgi:aromatic ring hydroxylase
MRLIPLPPLTPGGKPRTRVVVATLLDSGAWVPEAVITFVTAVFAPFFLSAVLKVVASAFASPAQPLPARIAARPELYAKMHERVEHYLAGHPDAP